jgi:hypothetical protein
MLNVDEPSNDEILCFNFPTHQVIHVFESLSQKRFLDDFSWSVLFQTKQKHEKTSFKHTTKQVSTRCIAVQHESHRSKRENEIIEFFAGTEILFPFRLVLFLV